MIYLDNAATSWPKPPQVALAMQRFLTEVGATPGRSGHRLSIEAGRIVLEAREAIAELFSVRDPLRVAFTANATEALNTVLLGFPVPGEHVLVSGLEHNSVMRPLTELHRRGTDHTVLPHAGDGTLDPDEIRKAVRPGTVLLVLNHGSNVSGRVLPVREAGRIARELGLYVLVDAAQTAGCIPIDLERDGLDFLAFTGHKGLYGPQGTGGFVLSERVDPRHVRPLMTGGTGSRSEHTVHPDFLPDRFEAGTPNSVGLAGLAAGVRFVLEKGVDEIRRHEEMLVARLAAGLADIDGVTLHGMARPGERTCTLSFCMRGIATSDVALRLDEEFAVLARAGLQCAPLAHRTLATFPEGTVRFSPGFFNTSEEMDAAVKAVATLAAAARRSAG
ncbi:MAG: aminotransferase class V-fold PLP-dependent enzyme [Deltaproteobacteria bacterium]|nr:aminotransferase class V-fold PLP-dependent enzyme [Deltaproteobacteria bacterium]